MVSVIILKNKEILTLHFLDNQMKQLLKNKASQMTFTFLTLLLFFSIKEFHIKYVDFKNYSSKYLKLNIKNLGLRYIKI